MTAPTQSEIATASTSSSAAQLAALLQRAGVSPLDQTGWIRVTGGDRLRWLNGMVTNSIQELQEGAGNYNFLLSVQGRIQGDATIFAEPGALLIETDASQVPNLIALLDRFIIMDDVELADVTGSRSGLLVAGPKAASLLAQLGLNVEHLATLHQRTTTWNSAQITVLRNDSPLIPRFELWADANTTSKLFEALQNAGAVLCDAQSLEWLRILEGTPLYGIDIRDRELPQETGQTRALHFAKGCYLGQEIVERIRSRGNVHRTFSAFRLDGQLPAAGTPLEVDDKQVGELTTVAAIPLPAEDPRVVQLALGYIRREALDRNLPVHYPGGTAVPVALPFSLAAPSAPPSASE
ncbi:MAG TPA: folate-binding protein [Edaphobacter sp.]|jgi:folate-binding protein YgfZ|nr:folate-binding protein [Edaphobacter sp.]